MVALFNTLSALAGFISPCSGLFTVKKQRFDHSETFCLGVDGRGRAKAGVLREGWGEYVVN